MARIGGKAKPFTAKDAEGAKVDFEMTAMTAFPHDPGDDLGTERGQAKLFDAKGAKALRLYTFRPSVVLFLSHLQDEI